MKKLFSITVLAMLSMAFVACGPTTTEEQEMTAQDSVTINESMPVDTTAQVMYDENGNPVPVQTSTAAADNHEGHDHAH